MVFSGDSLRYILSDGVPFIIEERLYGDVYIFTDDYMTKLLIAYDTDCINTMSVPEREVTDSYHTWLINGGLSGKPIEMFYSLDATVRSLVTCEVVPQQDDCDGDYIPGYTGCPINYNDMETW